jgi:hypothetical protein
MSIHKRAVALVVCASVLASLLVSATALAAKGGDSREGSAVECNLPESNAESLVNR